VRVGACLKLFSFIHIERIADAVPSVAYGVFDIVPQAVGGKLRLVPAAARGSLGLIPGVESGITLVVSETIAVTIGRIVPDVIATAAAVGRVEMTAEPVRVGRVIEVLTVVQLIGIHLLRRPFGRGSIIAHPAGGAPIFGAALDVDRVI